MPIMQKSIHLQRYQVKTGNHKDYMTLREF